MLLMEHHQRESRQVIGINTSESTAIVRRNNFNTMLLKLIFERRFIAENCRCGRSYPLAARRGWTLVVTSGPRGRGRQKSPPQFVLDLAVDALELGGKITHQHLQAPLAVIDDAPQFGALIVCEPLVGKPDPGLHDLAAPQLRPRVDEFDSPWHALIPRRAASGPTMPQQDLGFRSLCGMVNGRVRSRPRDGIASLAHAFQRMASLCSPYGRPEDGLALLAHSCPIDGVASLAYGRSPVYGGTHVPG
jgi:hypothetical protein